MKKLATTITLKQEIDKGITMTEISIIGDKLTKSGRESIANKVLEGETIERIILR